MKLRLFTYKQSSRSLVLGGMVFGRFACHSPVIPGITANRLVKHSGIVTQSSNDKGLGPTKDMSPFSTFHIWGNSSRRQHYRRQNDEKQRAKDQIKPTFKAAIERFPFILFHPLDVLQQAFVNARVDQTPLGVVLCLNDLTHPFLPQRRPF
jgi:hypothetical protein